MDREFAMEMLVEAKAILADGYDNCIIGIQSQCGEMVKAVYSAELIVKELSKDMSEEDAREYYEFNIAGAYVKDGPIFIETIEDI